MITFSRSRKSAVLGRLALAASAVAPLLGIPSVPAADSPDAAPHEATELPPMLITGSMIPTTDIVGLTPVDVFSQAEIQKFGAANVTEVIRKLPAAVGSGNYNESRANGGDGSARVALRGLAGGTLVLINGRRVAPVAFAAADVDINMIPVAAIDRIEILKDGASPVYGSDAVAGVVNIILRKDFEGVELYGYYGNTTETDAAKQQYSFVSGTSSERGSFVVGGNYYQANALFSQDRERSRVNLSTRDQSYLDKVVTTVSNPGRFQVRNDLRGGGQLYDPDLPADALVQVALNRGARPDTATGRFSPGDYHLTDANIFDIDLSKADPSLEYYPFDKFPYPVYTPAIRPAERWSVFGSGEYRLIDDALKFFTETYYTRSWSQSQLAATPINNANAGFGIPASNYYNPFGADISTWAYRFTELGPRIETIEKDAFRFVGGLRGQIPESSWSWETAVMYSEEKGDWTEAGDVNRSLLEQRAGLGTPDAFNPFGHNANSQAFVNDVQRTLLTLGKSQLFSIDARINGDLFELPAGFVKMSVGGERREEEGYSIPDDNKRSGDLIGYVGSDPLRGERDVNAAFGELYVPIFSEDNRIPGIYALNVRGAARYEHYSDFGDVIKPGVRVGYNPIDEHFTIHASFSQSFVAPTWAELYTTAQEDFPDVRDPYSGVFQQIQTTELGNPDLEPQESDNFLIGAEWRVKQIPGLKLAIDYFRIERENIPGGSTQYILDENAASGGPANAVPNPAFDPTRPVTDANRPLIPGVNPSPGLYSDLIQYDPVAGQYIRVTVPTLNLTSDKLDGFDLYASYELDLGRVGLEGYGTLLFEMNWQYLLTYEQVQVPGTPAVDRLGDFSSDEFGYSSLPRWRGYGSVFYMYRDFSIGFFANYTDNYRDDSLVADRMVDDYLTFDIQASYLFPYQIRLTAGCLNVMDEPPPVVVASFADNYDRDLHDLRQRFWYVSLSKRF